MQFGVIYDNHRLAEGGAMAEDLFDALLVHDTWDDLRTPAT